jgi:threonine dehydratase
MSASTVTTPATPLVRLSNLFPNHQVFAKCEHLNVSGSFKIRGALHLLDALSHQSPPVSTLVVPSMGNTALGCAEGIKMVNQQPPPREATLGFKMVAVVPQSITPAKDRKLASMGIEMIKVAGAGKAVLDAAHAHAQSTNSYMVHPHLDCSWTDGYQRIISEIQQQLPSCRTIVFPVGGGGLLMGLTCAQQLDQQQVDGNGRMCAIKFVGAEAAAAFKYTTFNIDRSHHVGSTIADGLMLDVPHAQVQQRVAECKLDIGLVSERDIKQTMHDMYQLHGMMIEPSSAVPVALVRACIAHHSSSSTTTTMHATVATSDATDIAPPELSVLNYTATHAIQLQEPIVVITTGDNIGRDDFLHIVGSISEQQ